MPLLDLSQVTEALIRLLKKYLARDEIWRLGDEVSIPTVSITGDPPDVLAQQDGNYALGLYLYHIQEDGYHKNLPEPAGNSPPVRFREMGLNLFYLLTAHGGTSTSSDPLASAYVREQRLMGLAVKAFHEYPVLDALTRIGPDAEDSYILPEHLRTGEDEFRITLHPATLEEINKVWTAATAPMRLSAIYQVDVVLLEAEKPFTRPTPVLAPRIAAAPFHPVWISGTESDCVFTLPGETRSRTVAMSPALITMGETFRILGADLLDPSTRIFLTSPAWDKPPYTDVTEWMTPRATKERIELETSSPVSERTIGPGSYQVYLERGGSLSNFSPLAVAPRIDSQTDPTPGIDPGSGNAQSTFSIHGGPFSGGGVQSVAVYLGSKLLRQVSEAPPAGCFRVASEGEIQVAVPTDLKASVYVVRVLVNGISTLPNRWFEVTA